MPPSSAESISDGSSPAPSSRGLGKTLQSIALVWTLLKQNPYANPHQQGVCVSTSTRNLGVNCATSDPIACAPFTALARSLSLARSRSSPIGARSFASGSAGMRSASSSATATRARFGSLRTRVGTKCSSLATRRYGWLAPFTAPNWPTHLPALPIYTPALSAADRHGRPSFLPAANRPHHLRRGCVESLCCTAWLGLLTRIRRSRPPTQEQGCQDVQDVRTAEDQAPCVSLSLIMAVLPREPLADR
jgi:hypothetical protein